MITKNEIKYIHSLSLKKFRDSTQTFVAEGPKVVGDLLPLFPCRHLYATESFLNQIKGNGVWPKCNIAKATTISQAELERLSSLKSPHDALALFEMPQSDDMNIVSQLPSNELCIALDGVQDPGNLGTIVRIADWFGIEHIFCSLSTADVFAPKVVQATMGAIGRVHLHYTDLNTLIGKLSKDTPIYGTFLDGNNFYEESLTSNGLIVMGNEGKGISPEIASLINRRLFIPSFPADRPTSESLNVSVATAVVCAEFRRRF